MKGLIFLLALLGCLTCMQVKAQKNLVNSKLDFVSEDTAFREPFIDMDDWRQQPVPHRYIHGGFRSNGTRFSFYLPEKKNYKGHFFQYVTPFPDSETVMQNATGAYDMIGFAVTNGAYFIETNGGGKTDFTTGKQPEATIGAYRSHAACAELSRTVVRKLLGGSRPYGYVFGGSGGAYRTLGCIENTRTWDGAVPFVLGSPVAIPSVFAVRMNALRILKDKLPQIVDALEPGGSGDPYKGLNQEEYQTLKETTAMGFPLKSWYGWKEMDVHGFLVLYKSVVAMDESYFHHDFWNVHGYLGANPTTSLLKARVQKNATIETSYTQDEAEQMGLAAPMDPNDRGSADRAWMAAGMGNGGWPVVYKLSKDIPDIGMGGDLIIQSGDAKGEVLQLKESKGRYIVLAPTNNLEVLTKIKSGDEVKVDNSDFLAVQTYHRHQVPSPDYYVWDYFRDSKGNPIYPQRPMLLGPLFTMGASGCVPSGNINGKVILCCSLYDRESFPWQGDWYRNQVYDKKGDKAGDMFRLWYTDRALHGDGEGQLGDQTQAVSYNGVIQQALLDISDWVEKGIAPAQSTNYRVDGGQIEVPEKADERRGIQPVVKATIATIPGMSASTSPNKAIEVSTGTPVTIHVEAAVPQGMGRIVKAEWSTDGQNYTEATNLKKDAHYSEDGSCVIFDHIVTYKTPGTHFVAVRVTSQRNGKESLYTRIYNIDRVRITVK